jgi:hypothetical protein
MLLTLIPTIVIVADIGGGIGGVGSGIAWGGIGGVGSGIAWGAIGGVARMRGVVSKWLVVELDVPELLA